MPLLCHFRFTFRPQSGFATEPEGWVVITEHQATLTFENFLSDPLIRMVMKSDGITVAQMAAVLEAARQAVTRREEPAEAQAVC